MIVTGPAAGRKTLPVRRPAIRSAGDGTPYPVATLVRFRDPVAPRAEWVAAYQAGLDRFAERVRK